MAKSWLESFLEKEAAYASALKRRGSQALDELDALATGFNDEVFQLSDRGFSDLDDALARSGTVDYLVEGLKAAAGAPVRAIDRSVEALTGRPLIQSAVEPGVSEGEVRKAKSKMQSVIAEEAKRRAEREASINATINDLRARSTPGAEIFVSGPSTEGRVVRGDRSTLEAPRRGSFSRTKMVDYDNLDDVIPDDIGLPPPLVEVLQRLSRAKTQSQADALKMVAGALAKSSAGSDVDETDIMMKLIGASDGIEKVDIGRAALRSIGKTEEEIDALMKEFIRGSE